MNAAIDRHLPDGVTDLFFEAAARHSRLEAMLRTVFIRWGYTEIIPPTFEYYESLATEAGSQLQEKMYCFFDRQGRTLALRPDLTIPTARIVGTKLYDRPLPLRFFYTANVFRYEDPQAGRQREFHQAGVELIGAASPAADAEVIALAVECLRAIGLRQFQITLGQIGFFRALLSALELDLRSRVRLVEAVDRKNAADVAAALQSLDGPNPVKKALVEMPTLCGGLEVLRRARSLCPVKAVEHALDHLEALYRLLEAYGVAAHINLDLGEVRGMEYYTGTTFQGFAPGLGFPILSGGRYDDLIGHFGPPMPAIGFALGIERALLVLEQAGEPFVDISPQIVAQACHHRECLAVIMAARQRGWRVEADVVGRTGTELVSYGWGKGARWVLLCDHPVGMRVVTAQNERALSYAELEGEMPLWMESLR